MVAPNTNFDSIIRTRTYACVLAAAGTWCLLILLAPILNSDALYLLFHRICHQLDGHSLHVAGRKLGVCARCSSIYGSFFLTLIVYPLVRPLHISATPPRHWIVLSALPMVIDVAASMTGLRESTMLSRVLTGSLFGASAVFFVVPGFLGAMHHYFSVRTYSSPSPQ
jgi:uncharacterized membrane protein